MSIITLTTDFGSGSPYVAAMKGVILSLSPGATVIDITHAVPAQDIRYAAVVLEDVSDRFPEGTVHVVVVDPGVGTDRAMVFARIGRQNYLAPDNGVLSRLARRTAPAKIVRLGKPEYWLDPVSATFHGRDILAPVAARLSLGLEPDRLGAPLERLVMLDWPEVRVAPGEITGSILFVDSFGNLVTDIPEGLLPEPAERKQIQVWCRGHHVAGLSRTYGDVAAGALAAIVGSTGRLEIALIGGSALAALQAQRGVPVHVTW
jgi:S-adenosyl-L-methionine hydrolase (adenosine-forming)